VKNLRNITSIRINIILLFTLVLICKNNIAQIYNLDTLHVENNNASSIPFISNKSLIFDLFGKPSKIVKHQFVDLCGDKQNLFLAKHYLWSSVYYIKIDRVFLLNSVLFKDKYTHFNINDSIILNSETKLLDIQNKFKNSYIHKYMLSLEFSSYDPDNLVENLIVIPFQTKYGRLELIFYQGKLFYIETNINNLFKYYKKATKDSIRTNN